MKNFFVVTVCSLLSASIALAETPMQITTQDGNKLSAIMTSPEGPSKGALLIIQGSGNVGTDGDVSGPFLGQGFGGAKANLSDQLAHRITDAGYSTLRFAKRGFDNSKELSHQTLPYIIQDAKDAFKALEASQPGLHYGIVGFSEGASVAINMAAEVNAEALFLISPIVHRFDEAIQYQFKEWPVDLLQNKIKMTADGIFTGEAIAQSGLTHLPLTPAPWQMLDPKMRGTLSLNEQLIPFYDNVYQSVLKLTESPELGPWYRSFLALPPFIDQARAYKGKLYFYTSSEDSQSFWGWTAADISILPIAPTFHLFSGVGHCFSPYEGKLGEIKTSGPFSNELLGTLAADVRSAF